jgi:hypothetical protein
MTRFPRRTIIPALLGVAALLGLAACEEHKGPAERAGASIDRAGHNLRDAVDPPKGPGESLGRKIDRATQ